MRRLLNQYESFIWMLGREEPFLVQWTLMLSGHIEHPAITRALKLLQRQHPLLNSTVTQQAPFEYQPIHNDIKLRVHHRKNDTSWQQHTVAALNQVWPVNEEDTFLVVDWVQGEDQQEIIFTMDHAFCDLRCVMGLGIDFLKFLDQTIVDIKDIKIKYYPELPPIHDLLPTGKPAAPAEAMPVLFTDPSTPLLAEPPYHFKLPYTLKLSQQQTEQLLAAVRKNKCTVHSLFSAAMTHTLNDFLLESGYKGETFCFTPADIKPYLNAEIDMNSLGNFVGDIFHPFVVGNIKPLWDLARHVKQDVADAFATDKLEKAKQHIAALFQDGISLRDVVRGLKIRDACAAVSNGGVIPVPTEFKNFKLRQTQVGSASSVMSGRGRVFWLVVTTLYGELQLDFLHTCPIEALDKVPEFAERLMTLLAREHIISMP